MSGRTKGVIQAEIDALNPDDQANTDKIQTLTLELATAPDDIKQSTSNESDGSGDNEESGDGSDDNEESGDESGDEDMYGGRRRSRRRGFKGSKKGKTRKGNKMLSSWVAFVKKVQKEEQISYSQAMKRASARKKEWKMGQMGGDEGGDVDENGNPILRSSNPTGSTGSMSSMGSASVSVGGRRRRRSKRRGSKKRRGSRRR
jgi:hypothetical protein